MKVLAPCSPVEQRSYGKGLASVVLYAQVAAHQNGEAGNLTEDGIDFATATAAVDASDLSADAKANVVAVLNALKDAPGAIEEKLDALKSLLKT